MQPAGPGAPADALEAAEGLVLVVAVTVLIEPVVLISVDLVVWTTTLSTLDVLQTRVSLVEMGAVTVVRILSTYHTNEYLETKTV